MDMRETKIGSSDGDRDQKVEDWGERLWASFQIGFILTAVWMMVAYDSRAWGLNTPEGLTLFLNSALWILIYLTVLTLATKVILFWLRSRRGVN